MTNKSSKKIDVKVVPYGNTMVKIVEGDVKEGDVLVQQSKPKMSGLSKNRGGMMGPPGGMGARPPRM